MGYKLPPNQLRHLLVGIGNRRAAKLVNELQRGDQWVVFHGSAKDAKLNGAVIGEIDAGVALGTGSFRAVRNFLGAVLPPVASRPLLQLPLGAARKPQNSFQWFSTK